MKRFLAAASCLVVGFVLGVAYVGSRPSVRAVSLPIAMHNGDTNGDGGIDISDAVYLLNFLFTGGSPLAEIKCPDAPPAASLVATGQTKCLGSAGLVDCGIPKARGQDGFYQLGCPLADRFTDNGDGTISDHCTGLMWTKLLVDVDGDGEIVHENDALGWLDACAFAEDMTYLGHDDWRLPNVHELMSIMNFGEPTGSTRARPYMTVFGFPGSWSSTHNGTKGIAVGELTGPARCECSMLGEISSDKLEFAAVRGP